MTTAVAIFWDAVNGVFDLWVGQRVSGGAEISALWVALFTVGLKLGLTLVTRRIGTRTGNAAVIALAYDHRNDVFSATAAALGITLGRMGYPWVDPLAGALVALVILRTGIVIVRESSTELMDTLPGEALAAQIHQLLRTVSGVEQVEKIEAHRFGPYLTVNLTIGVNGAQSIKEGDMIASAVERTLVHHIDFLAQVHVHYHPSQQSSGTIQPAVRLPEQRGSAEQKGTYSA
jgi:cation diffusion facilitator family transporter